MLRPSKNSLFILISHSLFHSLLFGEFSTPTNFSSFQSNLGAQSIVDVADHWVGLSPQEIAPGSIPLGSLIDKKYIFSKGSNFMLSDSSMDTSVDLAERYSQQSISNNEEKHSNRQKRSSLGDWVGPRPHYLAPGVIPLGSLSKQNMFRVPLPKKSAYDSASKANYSLFTNTRPYFTSNVFRSKSDQDSAGVFENTVGGSVSYPPTKLGDYISLIPRLDLILVASAYEKMESNAHEDLESIFALVKAGLSFELPLDFVLSTNLEFNSVRNLNSGDKIFDAWVPSLAISKILEVSDSSILMLSSSFRQSITQKKIANPLPGVFDNDGNNFQAGINLSLITILGENGQYILMPSLGINRTEYQKHAKEGYVHWTSMVGFNASWQMKEWLSINFGTTLTLNQSNEDITLNPGAEYEALEFGTSLSTSFLF